MSDDKSNPGGQNRKLISLSEDYEVRDWAKKFGGTTEELTAAVKKVGNKPPRWKRTSSLRGDA